MDCLSKSAAQFLRFLDSWAGLSKGAAFQVQDESQGRTRTGTWHVGHKEIIEAATSPLCLYRLMQQSRFR
jgi:hypothetical protein